MNRFLIPLLLLCMLLAACDVPQWLGENDEEPPLPGERIAILGISSGLAPDPGMEDVDVVIPPPVPNTAWPQTGGNAASVAANVLLPQDFSLRHELTIADGNGWDGTVIPAPVVGDGKLFAIDAKGYIGAYDALQTDRLLWKSTAVIGDEERDILGGGLAYSKSRLFVTTGYGLVLALDAENGKELWREEINIPLRAPPRIHGKRVFVLSADNQLFAFSAMNGNLLWTHRGINEAAGFLSSATPSASEDVVVVPYSSGMLHGIDAVRGAELWTDTLALTRRTQASATLAGIGGNPVIASGVVFAASHNGFMAANLLRSGRRLWEQNISAGSTPWLAGQFIYVLSPDYLLACLRAVDGAVKWVRQLPQYEDMQDKTGALYWHSPFMAGGKIYVVGAHGVLQRIDPKSGAVEAAITIAEDVYAGPLVAGGRLYLLDRSARLYIYY